MFYIGVDIGGMSIKAGLVSSDGKIAFKRTVVTEPTKPSGEIAGDIAALINGVLADNNLTAGDIAGAGVGVPGSVYDEKGVVRYCCNINFVETPLVELLKKSTGIDNIKISNDANCAALAETRFGAGTGAKNSVMVTLGTGVGTGIIVDGRLLTGNQSAGAEGGHMQINLGGPACGCGKRGHFEAYASATALINQTAEVVKKHPESLVAEIANKDGIDGKTLFIAAKQGDKAAKTAVAKFIKYVGTGLVNFGNIFFPEVIIIGGGLSNEGDMLIKPIDKFVSENVYGAEYSPKIKVVAATLKNDAGIIGAAALCFV